MGIKRVVDTGFWTDSKVDEFTPEDKFFMLYLLTNPFSTQLGIYEISIKQAAFQMGYSLEAVSALIERFENKYDLIFFSKETNEIAIKNFLKNSIIKGGAPVRDCLIREMKKVKNKDLIVKVFAHIKDHETLNETVKSIIAEYEEKNGSLSYSNSNENNNENNNDNDNDVSYHDSSHESYDESFQVVVDLFNSICISLPSVQSITESRKAQIKKMLQKYTIDHFKKCFENAQASDFLKGVNDKLWKATFDWLIDETNMAKVIEGIYANRRESTFDSKEFFEAALERTYGKNGEIWSVSPRTALEREVAFDMDKNANNPPKTVGDDDDIRRRAEELKNKLKK